MERRQLGRTGLDVSEVGFGCWAIGGTSYGPTKDEESLEALETAWDEGVNFFDTADTYGHGHSESLLNEFFKNKPRDRYVIASKVGWDFYHGGSKKNFDPDYIRFACEESLKRLGLNEIDVYQLHNPKEELLARGEVIGSLDKLKRDGKIRFIGVSIHTEGEALACLRDGRVDTLQVLFNLLDQRMAEQVFEEAKKKNIGIIVREPLACGILSGKYSADHEFTKDDHRRRWIADKRKLDTRKLELIRSIVATNRLSLTRAALEYVLNFDAVSTMIPGAKTKAQILENVQASNNPLLRIEEASHLRDLYHREDIFQMGLQKI